MNRIKLLRFERGLTLEDVAQRAGIGTRTLARLEAGQQPTAPTAKALADFYEVSVADLLQMGDVVA